MKLENSLETGIHQIMMAAETAMSAVRKGRYDAAKGQIEDIQFHAFALLSELDANIKGKLIKFKSLQLLVSRDSTGFMHVYTDEGVEITDMLLPTTLDSIYQTYISTFNH
jgi:hypothetical protein